MARAAVRQLDGLAPEFSSAEEVLGRGNGLATDGALRAWHSAWLAIARLRLRIDATRDAAAWWLRNVPLDDADRAAELEAELDELTAAAIRRWSSLADRLADGGRRLAAMRDWRPKRTRPSPTAASTTPAARPETKPVPARPVAVALPIRAPERVGVTVRTSVVASAAPVATSRPPASAAPTPPANAAPVATQPRPAAPAPPPTVLRPAAAAPPPTVPRPAAAAPIERRAVPAAAPSQVAVPRAVPRAEPRAAEPAEIRRPTVAGVFLVVLGLGLAGALVVGTASMLSGAVPDDASQPPAAVGNASVAPKPSEKADASPTSTDGGTGSVIAVDAHPIGPLDPTELPITRVTGSPEVVALPSAFDRSVRLAGESGLCMRLPSASPDAAASVIFELQPADVASGGALSFGLPPSAGQAALGLRLDPGALATLDPASWYRVTVRAEGEAGHVTVAPVGGGPEVIEASLAPDPEAAPTSGDETCIHASLGSPASSVLVDRLRAEP